MDNLNNPYVVTPLVVWAVCQMLKFLIPAFGGDFEPKNLVKLEGSPASLVAASVSLVPVALAVHGSQGPAIGLALVLALSAIYYQFSYKVRIASLEQKVNDVDLSEQDEPSITSATWWGALTGFVFGWLLTISYWKDDIDWLNETPVDNESKIYIFIFIAIIIIGEILVAFTKKKDVRKLPTSRKLKRTFRLTLTLPASIGLVFALLQNQTRNATLTDRLFTTIAFVVIPILTVWAYFAVYRTARAHLAQEKVHFVEEKKKTKSKKKKKRKKNKKRH